MAVCVCWAFARTSFGLVCHWHALEPVVTGSGQGRGHVSLQGGVTSPTEPGRDHDPLTPASKIHEHLSPIMVGFNSPDLGQR